MSDFYEPYEHKCNCRKSGGMDDYYSADTGCYDCKGDKCPSPKCHSPPTSMDDF